MSLTNPTIILFWISLACIGCGQTPVETKDDLDEVLNDDRELSFFLSALKKAGILESLTGTGQLTIFAPVNTAFNSLPGALLATAATILDFSEEEILRHHILISRQDTAGLVENKYFQTFSGARLGFKRHNSTIAINQAVNIIHPDIEVSNGLIHKVDAVLFPPLLESKLGDGSLQDDHTLNLLLSGYQNQNEAVLFPQTDFLFSTNESTQLLFPDNYLSILLSQVGQTNRTYENVFILADSANVYRASSLIDNLVHVVFKAGQVIVVMVE